MEMPEIKNMVTEMKKVLIIGSSIDLKQPRKEPVNLKIGQYKLHKPKTQREKKWRQNHNRACKGYVTISKI